MFFGSCRETNKQNKKTTRVFHNANCVFQDCFTLWNWIWRVKCITIAVIVSDRFEWCSFKYVPQPLGLWSLEHARWFLSWIEYANNCALHSCESKTNRWGIRGALHTYVCLYAKQSKAQQRGSVVQRQQKQDRRTYRHG